MCTDDEEVSTLLSKIRGLRFDARLRTPSEWNGQRHWLRLANKDSLTHISHDLAILSSEKSEDIPSVTD
ncbi:hypothetical protein ACTXT7_001599 [Hymenolepis weldensis]